MDGMQQGLKLCFTAVIPGLFPFFLLTALLNHALRGWDVPILAAVAKRMGIPEGGSSLLIPAFLGGYPMGAKAAAQYYTAGAVNKAGAQRLLMFCNNAGPAFFFGFLPAVFGETRLVFYLWVIHVGSALFIALLLPPAAGTIEAVPSEKSDLTGIMLSSIKAMAMVCGWILCFRVISAAADKWLLWRFPQWIQILTAGILELANGCSRLAELPSLELRFLLASGLLGFGGLCVTMQTASMLGELSMGIYLRGKLLQTVFSLILAAAVVFDFLPGVLTAGGFLVVFVRFQQNRGGKIRAVIV